MKALAKYWKVIVAVLLILAAVLFYFEKYRVEKKAYESESSQLASIIMVLENKIQENMKYADIQDKLDDAMAEIDASRLDLYKSFPVEMKEEDQIMYVLYLETLFKEEISFKFNQAELKTFLRDGSELQYLELEVNYRTTYEGFQNMVDYLSTDSRIASVNEATIDYDVENDEAVGKVKLWLYLMDSEVLEYTKPDVAVPETGKENIFEHRIVWVSENSMKYHTDSKCSNMKNPTELTLEEAEGRGRTACPKCYITVWVEEYGPHYHSDSRCSNMKDPYELALDKAMSIGRTACSKCCVSSPYSEYVYVWVSKNGPRYHSSSSCSNMHNPYQISLDKAKTDKLTRCTKCY